MSHHPDIVAVVLAAGKGKRMNSDLPKVLHPLAGSPMIVRLVETLERMELGKIVLVVGHGREMVYSVFAPGRVEFVTQEEQRGTADAVRAAELHFADFEGSVLVLAGDVPLLRQETLERLITDHQAQGNQATVLTSIPPDATGYGRIVRGENDTVKRIVEHADASDEERRIGEINTGIFLFDAQSLYRSLALVKPNNKQGEYYLTDVVSILIEDGKRVGAVVLDDYREALGVNSQAQLQELEDIFFELNA